MIGREENYWRVAPHEAEISGITDSDSDLLLNDENEKKHVAVLTVGPLGASLLLSL